MKVPLDWKVRINGQTLAACHYPSDAAALVGMYAQVTQAQVLLDGHVVWTEGADGNAADSWDAAADLMLARAEVLERNRQARREDRAAKEASK